MTNALKLASKKDRTCPEMMMMHGGDDDGEKCLITCQIKEKQL